MKNSRPTSGTTERDLLQWVRRQEANARSPLSPALISAYRLRWLRPILMGLAAKLEGGRFFSKTMRDIFKRYYGVEIGMYSYGGCFIPGSLPRGTTVGNYSSTSSRMLVYRRNHPTDRLSQHPFFYNSITGLLEADSIEQIADNPLHIGHDSWIGHQVVILPGCRVIGDGSIVGAGSIVTHDVEPFTIVGGNPARAIRRRFSDEIEQMVLHSQWWLKPLPELADSLDLFIKPLVLESLNRLWAGREPSLAQRERALSL